MLSLSFRRCYVRGKTSLTEVDATGIPLQPTWSVHELLSSYPCPTITPVTLKRLHELSALISPSEGTPEHAKITQEMEELVRLVEAVKFVDVGQVSDDNSSIPDGRIWASGKGVKTAADPTLVEVGTEVGGRTLLAHASRTMDGFYVVETGKARK